MKKKSRNGFLWEKDLKIFCVWYACYYLYIIIKNFCTKNEQSAFLCKNLSRKRDMTVGSNKI